MAHSGRSEATADQQAARDADGAERVQPVGVLHDAGLGSAGLDAGAVAVRLDGVGHVAQQFVREVDGSQESSGRLGREP